ncbi:hypothetical protein QRX50_37175 [Amycolatopsis carbonis]|uniref:Uncharacterized protein n=1 Tax=Amycolatopsis carbonis TaxID=715471 RepID=A0A9Y2MQA0_9PSEU|nr:hypothetical protein [Amycolatopsis sp. 2-15]WIX77005.1 hypothetical protein QRX50_37175 [Amycolatopsis sp. 2-15]
MGKSAGPGPLPFEPLSVQLAPRPPELVVVSVAPLDESVVAVVVVGLVVSVSLVVGVVSVVGVVVSQSGVVNVLSSRDTWPLRASARPATTVPVVTVIEVSAMIVPTKFEVVPSVAELSLELPDLTSVRWGRGVM